MPKLPTYLEKRVDSYYYRRTYKGERIRKSLGSNLQEAKRKALLLSQQLETGSTIDAKSGLTVSVFAERWLKEYIAQRRGEKDQRTAKSRHEMYVAPVLGAMLIESVKLQDLRALRAFLDDSELSKQSVWHVLSNVRCMFYYAVDVGVIQESPWRSSIFPKIKKKAPKRIPDEDLERVLAATPSEYKPIVELSLYTGLRWGEIQALQWRHVIQEGSPHLVVEETKSGEVRRVPLCEEAESALWKLRAQTSSVFVSHWRAKSGRWVTDITRKQTGIKWTFHQLRHTFACRWLNRGGSKETLQKILGHASISTTERYGEMSDDAVFAEMERVHLG